MGKKKLAGPATLVTMFPTSEIKRLLDAEYVLLIKVGMNKLKEFIAVCSHILMTGGRTP
jgi:hypothetical protein